MAQRAKEDFILINSATSIISSWQDAWLICFDLYFHPYYVVYYFFCTSKFIICTVRGISGRKDRLQSSYTIANSEGPQKHCPVWVADYLSIGDQKIHSADQGSSFPLEKWIHKQRQSRRKPPIQMIRKQLKEFFTNHIWLQHKHSFTS